MTANAAHLLIIRLDRIEQAKLDAGEFVFPEHLDSRDYVIHCVDPSTCVGWMDCHRQHICQHGHEIVHDELSPDGPCPGVVDDNCIPYYDDEAQFHGEWHTHRWGYGWTVRWPGCVVGDADWDYGDVDADRLPIGEYGVNDDWDDTWVTLALATEKQG